MKIFQTAKAPMGRGTLLFTAVLVAATVVPQILSVNPAAADDGGYPWVSAAQLFTNTNVTYDWGYNPCPSNAAGCMGISKAWNGTVYGEEDPYTMEFRNCTSYAAWKINQYISQSFSGWGNASNWHNVAPSGTVKSPSNYTPVFGDLALWDTAARGLGHVAFVSSVSNGIASLYEYNSGYPLDASGNAQWGLFYSGETTASTSRGTPSEYIHFSGITNLPTDTDGDGVPDSQDLAPTMPGPVNNRGVPFYAVNLAGDFNGDGKQDIAAFYNYDNQQTKLWLFAGNGSGGFAAPAIVWDSGVGNWNWNNMKPFVGDFNGDGKTDIGVFYNYGNQQTKLWVFYGGSSGPSAPVMIWDSGVGNWDWSHITQISGDFNADGKTDIGAFYDYSGQTKLWLFIATASGVNAPAIVWDSGPGNADWWRIKPVVGDFNNDGKPDVGMFYNYGNQQTKLWMFYGSASGPSTPAIIWDSGIGNWDWVRILVA